MSGVTDRPQVAAGVILQVLQMPVRPREWALVAAWVAIGCGVLEGFKPPSAVGQEAATASDADRRQTDQPPADQIWVEPLRSSKPQSFSPWYPAPIMHRAVRIIEFGPTTIRFVDWGSNRGAEQQLAASRVLWLERGVASDHESRGLQLFAEKKYAESLPVLVDAIGTRPPVWHQQWLSMVAAQAAWRSGRSELALELISQVDLRPLPPLVLAWLPIQWDSAPTPRDAINAASARLTNPSAAVRLVAASWLLETRRGQASQVLRLLESDESRSDIARLARMVTRRTASPPEVAELADRWLEELRSLPLVFQVGPTVMLMHKFQASGKHDRSRRLRLSLELTPPHPHPEIMELAAAELAADR